MGLRPQKAIINDVGIEREDRHKTPAWGEIEEKRRVGGPLTKLQKRIVRYKA